MSLRAGARGRLARVAALVLLVRAALPVSASAADQSATEVQVKAAFLFNFLKFVEWPEESSGDPHGKWVIGVVGYTPIGFELARLIQGKNVGGRELQVKAFHGGDDVRGCNILFISDSERRHLPTIFAELRGSSVLTVADMDNFIESGGMVQFAVEENRVRITIDAAAASRARLRISSKLLSLARVVTTAERGANN